MKHLSFLLFITSAFSLLFSSPLIAQSNHYENLNKQLLEDFENEEIGTLPSEWYDRDGNNKLPEFDSDFRKDFKYQVEEEQGNKFLKFEGTRAKHINYPLKDKEDVNIYETPVLSWRARAWQLPQDANEDIEDRNDAVMSVYVVWGFGRVALVKKVPKSIRYTWSTSLDEGTELSKLFGNQKIIVLESGEENIGEWQTFERNIVEDYRRLYGDDPPERPLAILIMSDGDSTGSWVEADYDDIILKAE